MDNRAHSRSASMPITIPPPPPGYIDAVAVQERDLNSDDDFGDAGEMVYYHTNTLFSVYALTEATENVVERYRYDAYGAYTVLDADWSADADGLSDVDNPYAFTGRRCDVECDLVQYRRRIYSTCLGRFASRDPEGYVDWFNVYWYASAAPQTRVDPAGTDDCIMVGATLVSQNNWSTSRRFESTPWSLNRKKCSLDIGKIVTHHDQQGHPSGAEVEIKGVVCFWERDTWESWTEVTDETWRIDLICFDCDGNPYPDTDYTRDVSAEPKSTPLQTEEKTTTVPLVAVRAVPPDSLNPTDAEINLCVGHEPPE